MLALAATGSSAKQPFASSSHALCGATRSTLFACQLLSGEWISLCLRPKGDQSWGVALVDGRSSRRRDLADLKSSTSSFAGGGSNVVVGTSGEAAVALFMSFGGDVDQTAGAIQETRSGKTTTRFCRASTVVAPATFDTGLNAPIDLTNLTDQGVAEDLDPPPPWPDDRHLPCAQQEQANLGTGCPRPAKQPR